MGLLDRAMEKASEVVERGSELARQQQLKLELRRLTSSLDEAYAAYGRRAFSAHGSGATADLETEAQAIRDAQAAVDAKQAEIALATPEAQATTGEP